MGTFLRTILGVIGVAAKSGVQERQQPEGSGHRKPAELQEERS
jgi:hypothetical protein